MYQGTEPMAPTLVVDSPIEPEVPDSQPLDTTGGWLEEPIVDSGSEISRMDTLTTLPMSPSAGDHLAVDT